MILGEMNWPDIRDMDKERVVAVYPIASFEHHGHHLPLLTDTIQLDAMVEGMNDRARERRTGRIRCLSPCLWRKQLLARCNIAGATRTVWRRVVG